ncbi:MAG: DUF58 domain-containing protein, partial [Candidatus Hydrogenedentota bacterium]
MPAQDGWRMDDSAKTRLLEPEFLNRLERLAILAKRVKLGVTKGERKSRRKGASVDFADYRDYVQGDDLRHVDWNIYGRLEDLYIKLFEEREDLTLHLLIDASRSMAFGTPHKVDFAKRLAAALGYIALSGHERVAIEAFSGGAFQRINPVRGKGSVHKLFAFIESVEAGGGTALEQACRGYLARNRSKGVAVIISDFFDEAGFEGAIKRLNQTGSDLYAIHVLAPEEIDPQLKGDLKLIDSETLSFAEVSMSRALMKKYHTNRDGFLDTIRRYCTARGIGHVAVSSDASIENVALDLLRRG